MKPIPTTRTFPISAALSGFALAGALVAAPADAQDVLQEFDFQNDVSGWSAAGDPATQLTWDGTIGSPQPGSLLLSVPDGTANGLEHKATGPCLEVAPSQVYTVQGNLRHEFGDRDGRCFAVPVFYDQASCQGEGSVTGGGDYPPFGQWMPIERSATSFANSLSMRVEFVMALQGGTGPASCNLDDATLIEGFPLRNIPVAGPAWLAVLALSILLVVRRALRATAEAGRE